MLIDDDARVSEPLVRVLESEGFTTIHASTGADGLNIIKGGGADLVLLDLVLPDVDGLEVCREIRSTGSQLPIIILTERADEVDVIVGLDAGADDYVPKPFRLAELVARIRARLRAAASAVPPMPTTLEAHGLVVNTQSRRAWQDGRELQLTSKEFDLLALLMFNADVTLTREEIMATIWDDNYWGSTRTLDTHISTLRGKIAPPRRRETAANAQRHGGGLNGTANRAQTLTADNASPRIITVRGVGFRFEV